MNKITIFLISFLILTIVYATKNNCFKRFKNAISTILEFIETLKFVSEKEKKHKTRGILKLNPPNYRNYTINNTTYSVTSTLKNLYQEGSVSMNNRCIKYILYLKFYKHQIKKML
jgi:archaellum component FlaF (FlaF/FlaG flagellin family)